MTRWRFPSPSRDMWTVAALVMAWLGMWGAWIADASAGLTQNAFYLSEWSTFLPDVRYGSLRPVPEVMRLALALGALALAVGLGSIPNRWLRWCARLLLAAPIGLLLLPPYPDVFSLWWSPSYGGRFAAASVVWIGLAACWLLDRRGVKRRRWSVAACAGGAILSAGVSSYLLFQPFRALYARELLPGWGLIGFLLGLALAAAIQLSLLIAQPSGAENKRGQ